MEVLTPCNRVAACRLLTLCDRVAACLTPVLVFQQMAIIPQTKPHSAGHSTPVKLVLVQCELTMLKHNKSLQGLPACGPT